MRRYESVIILDPDLPEDDIKAFTDRYTELIRSYGGDIIKVDDWGSKRLAYLVKKREKGRYLFFDYAGVPELIHEMERQFKISEEVIKFLSIKLDQDLDLEAFKAEAEAKAKEAASATVAAPSETPAEVSGEEPSAPAAPEQTASGEEPIQPQSEEPKIASEPTQTEEPKKEVQE